MATLERGFAGFLLCSRNVDSNALDSCSLRTGNRATEAVSLLLGKFSWFLGEEYVCGFSTSDVLDQNCGTSSGPVAKTLCSNVGGLGQETRPHISQLRTYVA